ncbi:MAG: hypothetical protein H7343_16720 [Undibacterium sp.]|nr:hypothetical protein [Opitutaceae bacterium]
MSASEDFGAIMMAWAVRTPAIKALVLIGSRERQTSDAVWRADDQSDWDFQVITSEPQVFATKAWTSGLTGAELKVYAARVARIGGVPKVNAIFAGAEADFVVLPAALMRTMKLAVALNLHRREGKVRRGLRDLAVVIRPGWRFLKGGETWDPLYRRVVADVADARLGDEAARGLADVFVCESVWVRRKIERGELLTAQRMIHRELAETNFRLLHELKLRRGERSFPEARRIERIAAEAELSAVSVSATLEAEALRAALAKSAATLRELMTALEGGSWRWPL